MHRTIDPASLDAFILQSPPDADDTPRIRAQHALDDLNDCLFGIAYAKDHEGTPISFQQAMDLYMGNLMRRDHLGPEPGKLFMSLNLPAEDMLFLMAELAKVGGSPEEALVKVFRERAEARHS